MSPLNASSTSKTATHLYAQSIAQCDHATPAVCPAVCEVCENKEAQPVYYLPETSFQIVRCTECGLGFFHPQPTGDQIADFYPPRYYGTGGKKFLGIVELLVRLVGDRHAQFLAKQISHQGRILDIGCGRGVTLRNLVESGMEAHGFEVSQTAVEGIDPRIHVRIAESLSAAAYDEGVFDEVVLWHVLEHIPNPRVTLLEIHRILRRNGTFVVAVPNSSSWQARWAGPAWFHLDAPRHLFHFPLPALRQILESTGFQYCSEHHFSLRQNPFGWIQSALNMVPWFPQNGLYALLHRGDQSRHATTSFRRTTRFCMYTAMILLSPLSLFLSIAAAVCRQGATVHLVCRKI